MPSILPHRVVIAGGGIGGLEAMLALRDLAGERVAITLVTPERNFHLRALSVEDPFARPRVHEYDVAALCEQADARLVRGTVASVDALRRTVTTVAGSERPYDDLVVALGARRRRPFAGALVFAGLEDAEAVHGLIQDVELGYVDRVTFVVPTGPATWPLPLYELALLTAHRAYEMGVAPRLELLTPEERPFGAFGIRDARTVARLLEKAGVELRTGTHVRGIEAGAVVGMDGTPLAAAGRVVTIPLLEGPRLTGLPVDPLGFIPVDERSAVVGAPGTWAVGDASSFPIKQGGVAARHAVEVATAIAARASAPVEASVARPVLRATLLTGGPPVHLGDVGGNDAKVATTYLGPALARLDRVAV